MQLASWLVRRYPRVWRRRYEAEMLALLEQHHVTVVTLLDLLVGMVTARLDPQYGREARLMLLTSSRKATWTFLAAVGGFVLLAQTVDGAVYQGTLLVLSVFFGKHVLFPTDCAGAGNVLDPTTIYWVNGLGTETIWCNRSPLLPLLFLLVTALVVGGSLYWAVTRHQWGFLALAVVCIALPVAAALWLVQQPVFQYDVSDVSAVTTPLGFLSLLGELEALAAVVFLSIVKATQALAARRYRLLGLVLGVDLALLLVFLSLANTSRALTLYGDPLAREFELYSGVMGLVALLLPFAAVGMTLLAVAGSDLSTRGWHGGVLGGASLLTVVMVVYLVFFTVGLVSGWQDYYQLLWFPIQRWELGYPEPYIPGAVLAAGLVLVTLLALVALRALVGGVVAASRARGAPA
jgi:hypothetical protein